MTDAAKGHRDSVISPMMVMAKLKRRSLWGIALQHNLREKLPTSDHRIDSRRTSRNTVLRGSPSSKELRVLVSERIAALDRKPRRDAVWGIEILFSLHPAHRLHDETAYFAACVNWVESWCGDSRNVVSAVVHRDEGAPHCHVLVLPICDGRMRGSAMFGHPPVLAKRQQCFRKSVAEAFGLREYRSSAEILTQSGSDREYPERNHKRTRQSPSPMLCRVQDEKGALVSGSSADSRTHLRRRWSDVSGRVEAQINARSTTTATNEALIAEALDALAAIEQHLRIFARAA